MKADLALPVPAALRPFYSQLQATGEEVRGAARASEDVLRECLAEQRRLLAQAREPVRAAGRGGQRLGVGLDRARGLRERQAFAARVIRERGPIRSEDLGAWLCERNLRHSHLQSCDYDPQNRRRVADALPPKGLVRY